MSDEVHGEYPPNANQVDHVWHSQALHVEIGGYNLDRLVNGMIQVAEALALAIEVFDHPTNMQLVQARRALEHAVRTLEGAKIA